MKQILSLICVLFFFVLVGCSPDSEKNGKTFEEMLEEEKQIKYSEDEIKQAKKIAEEIFTAFEQGKKLKNEDLSAIVDKHFPNGDKQINMNTVAQVLTEEKRSSREELTGLVENPHISDDVKINHSNDAPLDYGLEVQTIDGKYRAIFRKEDPNAKMILFTVDEVHK